MSEPKAVAIAVDPVVDDVYVWSVSDDRLGGAPSCAVAVRAAPGSVVVINPIRLEEKELDRLGEVTAILLTGAGHLRSAPHYREASGAAIWAPVQADLGEVKANETFTEGNELPGGLKVIGLPGPSDSECAFYLKRAGGVMIIGDALMNIEGSGGFRVLPKEYNPDPARTKQSLKKLLDYDFEVMVFGHGDPIRKGAKEKLRKLLA
jgi:glyoxylase-like metal-dependent hydrolase (beta-lactamase superfamily II)